VKAGELDELAQVRLNRLQQAIFAGQTSFELV